MWCKSCAEKRKQALARKNAQMRTTQNRKTVSKPVLLNKKTALEKTQLSSTSKWFRRRNAIRNQQLRDS